MKNIKIISPAKINLNLKIGNIQKNNLHKITSQIHAINLFDEIEIREMLFDGKQKTKITLSGKQKRGVPSNSENIVYKATKEFFQETKINKSVEIEITKNIPNKAGLGGASSNAVSVLKGLEKLFNKKIDDRKMLKICHKLGSDVPFFYFGAPHAIIDGTGEKVIKLKSEDFDCCIAILPKIQISTAWAFGEFDKFKNNLKQKTNNDFEKVIFNFFPDLANLKNEFLNNNAKKAGLTGSGSAIYAIFENENLLKKCAKKIKPKCEFFWSGKSFQI